MKKITSLLLSVLFCTLLFAQTIPQGINYQAVARDASGNELINQPLTIQFSIISDIFAGTISWQETHSVITNDYGLFTAIIGNGVSTGSGTSGSFALIDWSSLPHFLKVEIDDGGGYTDMGTTAFMSVPYALRAENISDPLWDHSGSGTQNTNTDKVVIATSTSGVSLEVVDDMTGISIQDLDDNTEIAIWAPGNGYTGGIGTVSQHDLTFFTANSDHLKLTTNGKFGVGNMFPSYDLDVTGDINFSGDLYKNGVLFDGGDDLGNHTATQNLDLDTNDIRSVRYLGFKSGTQASNISSNSDGDMVFTVNSQNSGGIQVMKIVDGTLFGSNQGVSIGSADLPSGYKLSVDGKVICEELTVKLSTTWPDYVFNSNYNLMSLKELQDYIKANNHLPNIPPANEIENGGLEMGEMTRLLMEKIEELTLYMIDANNRIQELEDELKKNK